MNEPIVTGNTIFLVSDQESQLAAEKPSKHSPYEWWVQTAGMKPEWNRYLRQQAEWGRMWSGDQRTDGEGTDD